MGYTQYENWEEYKTNFTENFTLAESYVICGVGAGFRQLLELFPEIKIQYCLDARAEELSISEWKLYPYTALVGQAVQTQKFIITAKSVGYAEIKRTLLNYGVVSTNITSLHEAFFFWGERYREKAFAVDCSVILTTHCNLRCRGCVQLVPYIKNFRYNSVETVIENLEQYFRIFDRVGELILTVGETMLYKELGQICAYIRTHFQDRYHELRIFTNGLITPAEAAIEELGKMERVQVWISDYSCCIEKNSNKLIELLNRYKVPYKLNNSFGQVAEYQWFDIGDPTQCKDGDVKERFQRCSNRCLSLIDHKIYYCSPSCGNAVGGITVLPRAEVCLDLDEIEQMSPTQRAEEIGKFSLGFIDNGYLEFCRFCNGMGEDVNTKYIRAGEQCRSK